MYIEKVKHITTNNKAEYDKEIQKTISEMEKWNMDYNLVESRYNSDENGYRAEISYGFWAENYEQ